MKYFTVICFLMLAVIQMNSQIDKSLIFSNSDTERVLKGEIITRMYMKNNPANANTDLSLKVPKTEFTSGDYSKHEVIVDEKAFIPYELNDQSKISFYRILTSYSQLKGMVYYSRKIQQPQTLILDAFAVVSGDHPRKTSDPVFIDIKPAVEQYFMQEDNRFGKLVFKSEIINRGNDFVMMNTTNQAMAMINNKGDNRIVSIFIYSEEHKGFFYYTVNTLRIRYLYNFIESRTNATLFSNRLRASTVHLAKLLGLNWSSKLNPWNEELLNQGKYRNY